MEKNKTLEFTDAELEMIDYALGEYQDHIDGDDAEMDTWSSIQNKLSAYYS